MSVPFTAEQLVSMAHLAVDCMCAGVAMVYPIPDVRPTNWPIPLCKADSTFRPLVILEYVDWALAELRKDEQLW